MAYFTRSSPAIASYDWLDITTNLGYKRYYPCISTLSGSTLYVLSNKSLDSQPRCLSGATASHLWILLKNIDFDITCSRPMISGAGKAWFNFTTYVQAEGKVFCDVNVYHYDGSTPTSLGTAASPARDRTGLAAAYFRECVAVTLTSKKFKIGDILRVTVKLWCWGVVGTPAAYVYCDPETKATFTDDDGSTIGSDMTVDIPFKIDL